MYFEDNYFEDNLLHDLFWPVLAVKGQCMFPMTKDRQGRWYRVSTVMDDRSLMVCNLSRSVSRMTTICANCTALHQHEI